MTKARGQIRPRLLNMYGVRRPKVFRQLCEHIHFNEPVSKRLTSLSMLYAYYPVTVYHPDYLPKSLVRSSDNSHYRIDFATWMEVAKVYLEVMMEMLISTGAKYLLPENCGELQIAKMRKLRVSPQKVMEARTVYHNGGDTKAFIKDNLAFRYHRNNGYAPVFHWKKKTYNLIRHRQMFRLVMKPKTLRSLGDQWADNPGLIYNVKTFKSVPSPITQLKRTDFNGYNLDQ